MMPTYTHQTATVDQMRNYAECVSRIYPQSASGNELLVLKIAVAFLFVGVIIGIWRGVNSYEGPIEGAFLGFAGALILEIIIFLVVAGLAFLFS